MIPVTDRIRQSMVSLHMARAQGHADAMRTALDQSYRSTAPLSPR